MKKEFQHFLSNKKAKENISFFYKCIVKRSYGSIRYEVHNNFGYRRMTKKSSTYAVFQEKLFD